ncbi:hypothetical protein [Rodentibacter genomosp. 2]|uniref:hypothetical protein n=1 Tax=Rodentibacter genomosp. 2 TaxID=1908266 RepID=UPI00117A4F7E
MKNNYSQLTLFIKSLVYTQIGVMLAIFIVYLVDNQYDNPFENIGRVANKVFFISTLPTIFALLWILYRKYTQKDEIKVYLTISILFFINIGILISFDIPFYNNSYKFSGGFFAAIIPLYLIRKLLPEK